MQVFTGIDIISGDATLCAAVDALARRLWALPAPRSLCELRLDEDDYAWIRRWARVLHRSDANKWLGMVPVRAAVPAVPDLVRREGLGLLLLLLAAEVARRDAIEGTVWPVLPECFNIETRTLLIGTGHPSPEMKAAIEAGARRFGLRQMFGVAGVQGYYLSVFLQFGFTRQGIERLPWWLAGYGEVDAVRELLEGAQNSRSFRELWQSLREYRQGLRGEHALRTFLADSPWVLPVWADALVHAARQRFDSAVESEQPGATTPGVFLSQPVLRWDGSGEPRFVCRILDLEPLGLTEARYDLSVGAEPIALLLRQEDGRYTHDEEVGFAPAAPSLTASLAAPGAAPVAWCDVQLWDPQDELVVFDQRSGRPLDPLAAMSPERDYLLLTVSDVALQPESTHWRLLAGDAYRLRLLGRGWSPDLRASLEGFELWTPSARHVRQVATPTWADRIAVISPKHARLGTTIDVRLGGLPEDAQLVSVRVNARPVRFSRDGTRANLEPIELSPELAASAFRLAIRLRYDAHSVHVVKLVETEICGVSRLDGGVWRVVVPGAQLTVADAKQSPYRFFLPSRWGGEGRETLALMEGDTFSSRLQRLPRPLGTLAGFGAELCVRPGPYNEEAPVLTVASAVVNPGQLVDAMPLSGRGLVLTLDASREPSEHHQVICWQAGQPIQVFPGRAITVTTWPEKWSVQTPEGIEHGAAVALGYHGSRIGAHWPGHLAGFLESSTRPGEDDRSKAALIRWMRFPVLAQPYRAEVGRLIDRSPLDVALAWLSADGLPQGLQHGHIDEPWQAVVRQLLWQWHPTPAQARALIANLGHGKKYPFLAAAPKVLAINPLLLGAVVSTLLQLTVSGKEPALKVAELRELRARLLGVDRHDAAAIAAARPRILGELSELLDIDSRFLERRLLQPALAVLVTGTPLQAKDQENLQVALGVGRFREYLAVLVIDKLLQPVSGGRQ